MRGAIIAIAAAAALLLSACSAGEERDVITVSAAASLTDAFTEIGDAYMAAHPDTEVRFNFAGSRTLAEQINAGAPVDAFAAASPATMDVAVESGSVGTPGVFARNSMSIAVPDGNPAGISSLEDLARPEVTVIVCNPAVPCGAGAARVFENSDADVTPASLEPDVRAVLTKIVADEADAGLVYRTDVTAAGASVEGIAIPDDVNVTNDYLIAVAPDAPASAVDFVDFVGSPEGQQVLASWGFLTP